MNITWYGQSCFKIVASQGKNSQVSIVTDPFLEEVGLKLPKLEADILLISHSYGDQNNLKVKVVGGSPFLISGPGEYDVKKVYIQGIYSWCDEKEDQKLGENTIYTIEIEDLKLCHLGDIRQRELSAFQIEKIGDVDILMVPVGGVLTVDSKTAAKIISQIGPKIVIPMHYQIPKLKAKVKLEGLDKFLKVMGVKTAEALNKLLIKKKDLSGEGMKIVVLKP